MPSTYTTNLGIEKIATGEQSGTWGNTTNTNLDILDQSIDGIISITLVSAGSSGSPNSLPITDGAVSNGRNKFIEFVDGGDLGATAYVQLTPNDAEKIVHIRNSLSASRSIIVFQGTYNASNDYEILNGEDVLLKFDGAGAGAVVSQVFANLALPSVNIDGGTIDGAVIGGASAAAGSFTTLSAADGSALTPSITNTGDTNTGIFFPAADTVGVAVGGTEIWRYGSNPTTAKNLIINGAISVAQRGTSFTSYGATNNAYSLDQYKIPVAGSASARWTVTQESSGGVSGNAKWLKALVTTADTPGAAEGQAIIQRPEGQSIQALRRDGGGTKAATYSFDVIVHADGGSGLSFPVSLPVVFIIHDNVTDREIVSDVSVAAADTWERVTVSFPEDTSGGGPVNTSSAGSSVGITLAAGSNYVITADTWQNNTNVTLKTSSSDNFADATNNYVGFTEVQLEVGSVATDFEHEDYGTTLAKCLRYFERIKPTVADARFPGGALTSSSSAGQHVLPFLVQKRAAPTVTGTAAATFAWVEGDATEQALTGISYVVTDLTCTTVVCVLSSAATGGGHLKRDGSDTTHIDASAEL